MAYTYLFFRPLRLPLDAAELGSDTVLPLDDAGLVRASLDRVLPGLDWQGPTEARVTVDGLWMEWRLDPQAGALSLRCSLRHDYRAIVQRLCDQTGWIAFDQEPWCYQPHRPPMRA